MRDAIREQAAEFAQQNPWWICKSCLNPDIWHDPHAIRLRISHKQDGCQANIIDTVYILYVFLRCPWQAKQALLMRLGFPHADENEEAYADDYINWLFGSWGDGPRPSMRNPKRPTVLLHMHIVILLFHSIRDPTSFGAHTGQAAEACLVTALPGSVMASNHFKKIRILQRRIRLSSSVMVPGPIPVHLLGPRTVTSSISGAPTDWQTIHAANMSSTSLRQRRQLTLPVIHLSPSDASSRSKRGGIPHRQPQPHDVHTS
jgi:hypothetical protein